MKITSIEKAPNEDVYNMEVEDTHCFAVTTSNIIIHNCMDSARYIVNRMKDKNNISGAAKNIGI